MHLIIAREKGLLKLVNPVLKNEDYSMQETLCRISDNRVYQSLQRIAQTGSNQNRKRSEQEGKCLPVSSL